MTDVADFLSRGGPLVLMILGIAVLFINENFSLTRYIHYFTGRDTAMDDQELDQELIRAHRLSVVTLWVKCIFSVVLTLSIAAVSCRAIGPNIIHKCK